MKLADLKIAVGHDDLTVPYAGGEKVFAAIAETFPQADIFTSMITPWWANKVSNLNKARTRSGIATPATHDNASYKRKIITSFMQRIPFKRKLQKALFMLYPLAFESFDLSDYDLVISSSSRFAHGVITRPETKHICYMHSPGRMFWEPESYFSDSPALGKILTPALSYLRLWDHAAAQRVNQFVANSKNIAGKIKRYYGRDAVVVYPFVDLERFKPGVGSQESGENYYLVVTRLAPWKRVEIAVEAANAVGAKLKVVGIGPDEKKLKKIAGPEVEILGGVPDDQATELFQNCSALIMTQEEDFGITSLEAQACGKPVIAYGAGGALETVVAGKTGEFFASQDAEALAKVLKKFDPKRYRPEDCRANAEKFSKGRFQKELTRVVSQVIEDK
jgi:glycosyltransferase involved in cell wall biosynthesis